MERKVSSPSSALPPPPLFRSIGPPGLSAGLPPHRRLRSLFCRSRAVLPADTHQTEAPGDNSKDKGGRGRWVTPLQTSERPAIKDKRRQKRRKRSLKVDCAGKYVVPSRAEKEEDARLCEWLESLGLAERNDATKQQRLFVSRCREQETSHRRDRRPHFLPPLYQSDSLLHVPLLLPENSPPPSPCTYTNPSIRPLPVPLLQPLTLRRK